MRARLSMPARVVLAGLVAVAGLAAPAGAATTQPADAATHGSAERGAPAVRRVARGYHDRVVKMAGKRQRLELTFRGTRGDRVDLLDERWFPNDLCARITLTHDGRRVPRNALAHFRLPRTGSYVFRYTPCRKLPRTHSLRLTLVDVVHPSTRVRRLPRRRGVLHAAVVRVPRSGMLAVADPTGRGFAALAHSGTVHGFNGPVDSLVLRPGHAPLDARHSDRGHTGPPTVGGQRVALLGRGGGSVVAGAPAKHPTTYDGPAVAPTGPLPQALTFEGQPGAWLQPQDGSEWHDTWWTSVLLGPDGTSRRPSPIHASPDDDAASGLWRLPSAGTWTLLFFPDTGKASPTGALRAAGVTVLPPILTDAAPTTFAPPSPGRAVIAPVEGGGRMGFLRLVRTYPGGPLAAYGGAAERPVCEADGPLGCGDGTHVRVDVDHPVDRVPFSGWVYVPFSTRETGAIDLQVTSRLELP